MRLVQGATFAGALDALFRGEVVEFLQFPISRGLFHSCLE
jgi:hypothetical protein